jgi:hypothetical protein
MEGALQHWRSHAIVQGRLLGGLFPGRVMDDDSILSCAGSTERMVEFDFVQVYRKAQNLEGSRRTTSCRFQRPMQICLHLTNYLLWLGRRVYLVAAFGRQAINGFGFTL